MQTQLTLKLIPEIDTISKAIDKITKNMNEAFLSFHPLDFVPTLRL